MLYEQWRLAAKEKKEEERGGGTDLWRLTVVLTGGGDAGGGGSRQRSFSLLSSASLRFFFLLCFSLLFSFGLQLLPSSVMLLPPLFSFLLLPPFVFIGKTRGGKTPTTPAKGVGWSGRPLCSRPRTALGVHPLFFHHVASKWGVLSASFWWFRKKRERAKQGRKVFFFPCSLRV